MSEDTQKPRKAAPKKQDEGPGDLRPELEWGDKVSVNGEPGVVTGSCYDRDDVGIRRTYRVGAGWFSLEQLEVK